MSVSLTATTANDNRVKTLVSDLSLQEKKQLVGELLDREELEEVWQEVFGRQIERYLEAEGQLHAIFATLADRVGNSLDSDDSFSAIANA